MKPVYLEFSGINSFSETAKIDFRVLLSGGVFGIFGDTGSGKSTILDAIHFALYGEIDRVPKSFNDCINYRSDGARVTFDFEITTEGVRHAYRVTRERKRKNGTTKAYLYEFSDEGKQRAIAEGTREVDERVERIIGLSFADFKTCIALPQGDFATLVKSTTADRVKLVARLFNLEKYGERLSKAVNARYYEAEEEVNLLKAKMGENEGGSDEAIALTQAKIQAEKEALKIAKAQVEQAERAYREAEECAKAKKAYETLCVQWDALNARLPQMQSMQKKLEVLPKAQAVWEKEEALQKSQAEERAIGARLQKAKAEHDEAKTALERATQALERGNYDEAILKLSLDLQRVEDVRADVDVAKSAEKLLRECIEKYNALKNKYPEEDFVGKRAKLEREIDALGEDDTLLDYLKRNYKGVLLTDAYGEIRADLSALSEKYPQAQADIQTLLKKYSAQNAGAETAFDITTIHLAFKEIERKRKTLREEWKALEERRLRYEENESAKKILAEQGKTLREGYNASMQKIAFVKELGDAETLSARMQTMKEARKKAKEDCERAQNKVSACFAETEKQAGLASLQANTTKTCEATLNKALAETGFSTPNEARVLLNDIGNAERAQAENKAFFDEYALVKNERAKTDSRAFASYDERTLFLAKSKKEETRTAFDARNKNFGALEKELERLQGLKEKYKKQQEELTEKEARKNLCDELRTLVKSNKFLEFIASEYLQDICGVASKTLLSLTNGRYFLKYDKEFKVGDNLDGGNLRGVKTLSGGETFLVSLSLALSLSSAICLKSLRPIEFFFLDEGFGTLDEKLVDTVMDVLGKLSRSFSVGLISHVEELKRRIDYKIVVTGANEKHGSQVKVECY